MKINELIKNVKFESKTTEFKLTLSSVDVESWAKTICAFANCEGGTIYIGVDNNGNVAGVEEEEIDKLKRLVDLEIDRHFYPHVECLFHQIFLGTQKKYILTIYTKPCEAIVRYKSGDYNEAVYIRGDGISVPASIDQIINLSTQKTKKCVDLSTTSTIYQESKWSDYLDLCTMGREDKSKPILKDLQNENLVTAQGFTVLGLNMFKDDYDGNDTEITCRLWDGLDKSSSVIDTKTTRSNLAKSIKETLIFIEKNMQKGWEKTENGSRKEITAFPKLAVREALVNAIAHRDYSKLGTQVDVDIYKDRIEIVSPGNWLLPESFNSYDIKTIPSIRRNNGIASALYIAGFMEKSGSGFSTIFKAYENQPKEKQPQFITSPGFTILKLPSVIYNIESFNNNFIFNEIQNKIIELLKESPKSVKDLMVKVNINSRQYFLSKFINPLIKIDKVERIGKPKSPNSLLKLK